MATARNNTRSGNAKGNNTRCDKRCGNCKHGQPYYTHNNLDHNGKPICVRCVYQPYAMVRSEFGCKHWLGKEEA